MTDGKQILDFVHVEDICAFYKLTITDLDKFLLLPQGKEFHLGTGLGHDLHEVAKIIEEVSHKIMNIDWGAIPYRERDTMHAVAPISCNENLWTATISLRQGIENLLMQNG